MHARRLPEGGRAGVHRWHIRARRDDGEAPRPSTGVLAMAVGAVAMLVLSCGDGTVEPAPPPAPVATTVTVNPGSAALSALGETARLSAEVRDQNGQVMTGAAVAWSSSDTLVAGVDASGLVTAAANGSATITATAGSVSGTAVVTVTAENPDRAALVALYNATDGPNWVNSENWLTDAPLGEWHGVSTHDHTGRVTRIELSGEWDADEGRSVPHGLTGSIPPEPMHVDLNDYIAMSYTRTIESCITCNTKK